MHLADHIRPLLRDHDCVIIPDFGGLVAEAAPARLHAGRQSLSPPSKLVAFNQALTRNDGLLVDMVAQHLELSIAQARERVRQAVAALQRELDEAHRTELPGIGIFRRASGRGLSFEYTGTDNLLPASFGLPTVAVRPVRVTDARQQRVQPVLRSARRGRLARWVPGTAVGVIAVVLLAVNYFSALRAGYLPVAWQAHLPQWEWAQRPAVATVTPSAPQPQQATLAHQAWVDNGEAAAYHAPAELAAGPTETPLETIPEASNLTLTGEANPADFTVEATVPNATEMSPSTVTPTVAVPAAAGSSTVANNAKMPVAVKKNNVASPIATTVATPTATPVVTKETAAATAPVAKPTAAASTTIKARTGRYFVIAGAYSSLMRAEQGRKVLARTGHHTRIILPFYGSRLFRLTAADYPTLAEAEREAQRLRISTHCDYNTLKF